MAEPIRYYMDEHLPAQVTQGLRRLGIDVLTAQEAGRCGLPDPDQLAFATAQERVMVTFDTDYLALHRAGVRHAGSAWTPHRSTNSGCSHGSWNSCTPSPIATRCATAWNTCKPSGPLGRRDAGKAAMNVRGARADGPASVGSWLADRPGGSAGVCRRQTGSENWRFEELDPRRSNGIGPGPSQAGKRDLRRSDRSGPDRVRVWPGGNADEITSRILGISGGGSRDDGPRCRYPGDSLTDTRPPVPRRRIRAARWAGSQTAAASSSAADPAGVSCSGR